MCAYSILDDPSDGSVPIDQWAGWMFELENFSNASWTVKGVKQPSCRNTPTAAESKNLQSLHDATSIRSPERSSKDPSDPGLGSNLPIVSDFNWRWIAGQWHGIKKRKSTNGRYPTQDELKNFIWVYDQGVW